MNNKKKEYHLNIGGASIILLLVVFALTVFAVLSIKASYHELKLSEKTREAISDYYKADGIAEEALSDLYNEYKKMLTNSTSIDAFDIAEILANKYTISAEDAHNLTYVVQMDYNTILEVCIMLNPEKSADKQFEIKSWRIYEMEEMIYDDEIIIWDGTLF